MDSDALRELRDIREIEQVVHRYAIAIDRCDGALLERCFTTDARLTMSVAGGYPSLAAYWAQAQATLAGLDATHHVFTVTSVRVDGNRAWAHSYYQAQHAKNSLAPRPFLMIGGWVDDEFARTDDGWQIRLRQGSAVWFDGNPAVLGLSGQIGASRTLARPAPPPPAAC